MGFDFSITTITQSNFIVNLKSHVNTVTYYTFYWIAVDDMRIVILTNFNIFANPQSTILQHNNPNAKLKSILLQGYEYKLIPKLGTFTATIVEGNIVQKNLKSMGYIVILGPKEFFATESQIIGIPKSESAPDVYTLRQVTINKFLLIQVQPSFQTKYSQYKFCTWAGFSANFVAAAYQCATLLTFTLQATKPILFHKLKISCLILLDQSNIIELSIPEASKTYEQQVTNDQIIVPNNLQSLTFNLRILYNKNYKITGQFYQCDSPCSNQYKKIIQQCYNLEAAPQFFVTYIIQNIGHYQQLNVYVTSSQIKMYQTALNQISSEQLICQFDVE